MKFGWLYTRPYIRPKACRWCGGPYVVLAGRAVAACPRCDEIEGWSGAGTD